MDQQHVLVTGGSGFIAGHCILQLLDQGHTVRTTLRSPGREAEVRTTLRAAGAVRDDALTVVAADLLDDSGWAAAVDGVDRVLHVASPVHLGHVEDEDAVITPAREGTLRVLRAARDAGVGRVVLTSAFHAVGFGHGRPDHTFTEDDWSVLDGPGMDAYGRSKVLAERAAWEFAACEGASTGLTTLLPVAVMGPLLGADVSGANHLVQRILAGTMPGYPDVHVPIVDVRDVATAHVTAMNAPGAGGQRILLASGRPATALADIGDLLRETFGDAARRVPTGSIPDDVVRGTPEFAAFAADLGYRKRVSVEKARRLLDLQPRTPEEAITAAARSMIDQGVIGA